MSPAPFNPARRGAGWNVIKGVWGRDWDPLFAQDTDGVLLEAVNTVPDGQFQTYSAESGAYIREHFFGRDKRLAAMVEDLTDKELELLSRGGHDYRKVYAAFRAAREHTGQPTVILAHKGWTLGPDFEARNDRLHIPISDEALEEDLPPYYHPGDDSEEIQYLHERRGTLGGYLPRRTVQAQPLTLPSDDVYQDSRDGSGSKAIATTVAFVRLLQQLLKDENIVHRFVPIIPDEARTFGMDSLFPTGKMYSPVGMTYEAVDRNLLLSWQESTSGQMLHEGISEAGAKGSAIAAGSWYATHGEPMIPIYVFYSMFGFQHTGSYMWAMADQLALVRDGLHRMYGSTEEHPDGEDIFYYLTVYNDPYPQPPEPDLDTAQLHKEILAGLYRYQDAPDIEDEASEESQTTVQLLASATSWNELRREALDCDEWNMLHPEEDQRVPYVTRVLQERDGPVVAVSDFMRAVPDQIAPWVPDEYTSLGTDGFGLSDMRSMLRRHFQVDAESIVVAALSLLARRGDIESDTVQRAIEHYQLDD